MIIHLSLTPTGYAFKSEQFQTQASSFKCSKTKEAAKRVTFLHYMAINSQANRASLADIVR